MRIHRRWFAAAALALLAASCREKSTPEQPTQTGTYPQAPVIVISIDTLRADRLPAYGYDKIATPAIDSLRRDAILFQNAYSHVPLTLPSHASLLTGKLPNEHGVRDNIGYRLADTSNSLPLLLKARGYETGAAVSAYVLRGETGLRPMFDWYDDGISFEPGAAAGAIQRPGPKTVDSALQWITPRSSKPFFFLLHLFEPHSPYDAPGPYLGGKFSTDYENEIAYVDTVVARFLDELKRTGVYDRALIILLSDHGEGLNDHGEAEHGIFVYREALHVPLLVKLPNRAGAGTTVARSVGLIDVLPTVASLTGATVPPSLRGISLTANPPASDRRVYAESMYGRLHLGWSELRSLVGAQHHFIEAPKPELYDITADPGEKKNILADERRTFAVFRDELAQYPRELQKPANISAEEQAKLTALGYLGGSTSTAASGPLRDPKDHIAELTAYEEANTLVQRREYDRAIASLRDVLKKNPRFVDARMQLAAAYEATGRYAEAESAYRALLNDNPALIEQVAIALGAVYMNLGKYDDAAKHADLAVRSNPGGARLLLGRIALARGDFVGAERNARDAMKDAHYHGAAALLGAEALLRQRQLPSALVLLEDAKRGAGSPVRGLELLRGDTLMRMQRVQEAEAAIREEIRTFPDNRDAYATLAGILLLQNRGADAMAVLESLVAANPAPSSYVLAARTLDALGQPAAAAEWRRRGAGAR